jgi:hypothetical protein
MTMQPAAGSAGGPEAMMQVGGLVARPAVPDGQRFARAMSRSARTR